MKIIKVLLIVDILLVLSGLGWIILGPHLSAHLVAFNKPISPTFFGITILLIALYQGLRLRKAYLRLRNSAL